MDVAVVESVLATAVERCLRGWPHSVWRTRRTRGVLPARPASDWLSRR